MNAQLLLKLVALAILACVPLTGESFYTELIAKTLVLAIFAMSLDLLVGFTGLVSFGLLSILAALSTPRMGVTIDSISHGRFGVNIVSGWAKDEYEQMGLWPGEAYFGYRYDYSTEFVTVTLALSTYTQPPWPSL